MEGGRAGCRTLFDEVSAREYGSPALMGIHRLTVDVYSLQHPEEFMRSGKSFLAHLTGMYAAMEEGDASGTNRVVQRWLSGSSIAERWEGPPPEERGSLTIAHVHAARDAAGHAARVREWARSTWDAWGEYHDLAREWMRRIRGEGPAADDLRS